GGSAREGEGVEWRDWKPLPDLARPELADNRRRAANVIGVAMRQSKIVEPADAGGSQHGCDDAIADVEGRGRRQAARIDEQRTASRKNDEDRVALPHVQEGDVQPAIAACNGQRGGGGQAGGGG